MAEEDMADELAAHLAQDPENGRLLLNEREHMQAVSADVAAMDPALRNAMLAVVGLSVFNRVLLATRAPTPKAREDMLKQLDDQGIRAEVAERCIDMLTAAFHGSRATEENAGQTEVLDDSARGAPPATGDDKPIDAMAQQHPAGWFDDPHAPGGRLKRYWDGTAWTEHVHDSKPDDSKPDDSKPDDSKPDDSKPGDRKRRRKKAVLIIAAACAAAALSLLLVEYNSEQDALSEYHALADRESTNRDAVLEQYQSRDRDLQEIVDFQDDIDTTISKMKQSDCYTANATCNGYREWNKNNKRVTNLFDQIESVKRSNQTAVGEIHKVAEPEGLWLLSLLGKDDSGESRAMLDGYLEDIRLAKESINQNISAIDEWNSDCAPDKALGLTCDAEEIPLEVES